MTDNVIWGIDFGGGETPRSLQEKQEFDRARDARDETGHAEAVVIPFSTDEYNEPPCA